MRGRGQLLHRRLQVAVVINVADDQFGDGLLLRFQPGVAHLFNKMLRQRGSGGERVEHELPSLLVLGRGANGCAGGGKMIVPFLIHLDELVKFRLEIVRRPGGTFLRGGILRGGI